MLETIHEGLSHLCTVAGIIALGNIIMIDLVMSGDNAILIGMATRGLPSKDKKKAITIGIVLATVLRIALSVVSVLLLQIIGVKFAGGLLLLIVVWRFYQELRIGGNEHHDGGNAGQKTLTAAIITIVLADVSMSLDNVLAVAGASRENIVFLVIGLVVSILLMAFASNAIAKYLDRYPQIQWAGLFVILFVALEMIVDGGHAVESRMSASHLVPFSMFVISLLFAYGHQSNILDDGGSVSRFLRRRGDRIYTLVFGSLLVSIFFLQDIANMFVAHPIIFYSVYIIVLGLFLESVTIMRHNRRYERSETNS